MQDKLLYINFLIRLVATNLLGLFLCYTTAANNSSYIALSNHVAQRTKLEVSANNIANVNTIGYEADGVVFRNVDLKQSSSRSNSFVYTDGTYMSESSGPIKMTHRPLDMAIAGYGYFKILTPKGERYSLNGAVFLNREYVLVNIDGLPFASRGGTQITLPADTVDVRVAEDATIYADGDEIDIFGIFSFVEPNGLVKEGNNLYSSKVRDILLDEYTIISGALRGSNVNSAKSMTEMIELQRSAAMTNNLLSNVADLEKSVITKVAK